MNPARGFGMKRDMRNMSNREEAYRQDSFFPEPENSWQDEWVGMPEYKNVERGEPLITATFKFKTQEDFDRFNSLLKLHLYDGQKIFDGMQRKTVKSAWYPQQERASNYEYK